MIYSTKKIIIFSFRWCTIPGLSRCDVQNNHAWWHKFHDILIWENHLLLSIYHNSSIIVLGIKMVAISLEVFSFRWCTIPRPFSMLSSKQSHTHTHTHTTHIDVFIDFYFSHLVPLTQLIFNTINISDAL